jgi:hypothetical protein
LPNLSPSLSPSISTSSASPDDVFLVDDTGRTIDLGGGRGETWRVRGEVVGSRRGAERQSLQNQSTRSSGSSNVNQSAMSGCSEATVSYPLTSNPPGGRKNPIVLPVTPILDLPTFESEARAEETQRDARLGSSPGVGQREPQLLLPPVECQGREEVLPFDSALNGAGAGVRGEWERRGDGEVEGEGALGGCWSAGDRAHVRRVSFGETEIGGTWREETTSGEEEAGESDDSMGGRAGGGRGDASLERRRAEQLSEILRNTSGKQIGELLKQVRVSPT